MTPGWRLAAALCCGILAAACGAAQPAGAEEVRASGAPVEMTLIDSAGQRFPLAALRGRPVLLFVFTTYDQASQLALAPLTSFLAAHRELQALGIAAQPNPETLLPLYRDALGVPFPLAYEATQQIVSGESMLGPIETVPTYVLLDADGRIVARRTGALTEAELEEFTAPALG